MQLGIIGLGKLGAIIARRLCNADIHVVGLNVSAGAADTLAAVPGFEPAYTLDALLLTLRAPRIVWCMLPSPEATRCALDDLLKKLLPGDMVIDGGNSFYKDSVVQAKCFEENGIDFIDAGVGHMT